MTRKALLALALALIMILSASCAGQGGGATAKKDAYDTYMQLLSSLDAAPGGEDTQFDMDMSLQMNMEIFGEVMSLGMSGNIKAVVEGGRMQYSAVMDMSGYGMGEMEMIFDGEDFYYAIDGVELDLGLLGMDKDALMAEMDSQINMPDFGLDAIKSVTVEPVGAGDRYTIIIDGDALADYALASLGDELDVGAFLGATLDIADVPIEIVIDRGGNPKAMRMQMGMEMMGMKIEMDMQYIINNIGSGVTVDTSKIAV